MEGNFPPLEKCCMEVTNDGGDGEDDRKEEDSNMNGPHENPNKIKDFGEETFNDNDNIILESGDKVAIAHLLLYNKSKKCAAKFLKFECIQNRVQLMENTRPNMVLSELIDILINPELPICNMNSMIWIMWLVASGEAPVDFYKTIKQFDGPTTCSTVWTSDYIAYRCNTCQIAQCMSICMDCFYKGDHIGHDYTMYKSYSGGVCDCGNPVIMNKSGFCSLHKESRNSDSLKPLDNLLLLARAILPHLLLRFILYCREYGHCDVRLFDKKKKNPIAAADLLIEFLQELCDKGSSLKKIVSEIFCTPKIYNEYTTIKNGSKYFNKLKYLEAIYLEVLSIVPFVEVPGDNEELATLNCPVVHNTFLGEFLFWAVKFEFPQKLVSLLLKMKLDSTYEDALAKTFVQHYSRIAVMLARSKNTDALTQRVVYVSVQFFSDNNLVYRMTHSYHLLHVMILCLKKMISAICSKSTLHDVKKNKHRVVDCQHKVMRHLCFWPLVADLRYILSFKNIADVFFSDARLLREWILILSLFQGMNNNIREITNHIEYEPQYCYIAYSAELKLVAPPLVTLVAQLNSPDSKKYTMAILKECLSALSQWFNEIGFSHPELKVNNQVTFHLALHRWFVIVLQHAVRKHNVKLQEALPSSNMLSMMLVHPLRVQVAYHEIINNLWVRNGCQIKAQAVAYAQRLACNSMADSDLFILQLGAGELPKDSLCYTIFERFHSLDPLYFSKPLPLQGKNQSLSGSFDMDSKITMLESCLTFLSLLSTNRHSIDLEEEETIQLEMMVIICMGDKTHSEVMDLIPEYCLKSSSVVLESVLKKVAKYKPECDISDSMKPRTYAPKDHVWEELFDPIFTQHRIPIKIDYQILLNRFKQYCKDNKKISKRKASRLWPPYRLPSPVNNKFVDPRRILSCRTFQAILYVLLYKCLYECAFNENVLSLAVYLFELTIDYQSKLVAEEHGNEQPAASNQPLNDDSSRDCPDGLFYRWYSSDNVFVNSTVRLDRVVLKATAAMETQESSEDGQLLNRSQIPSQLSESEDAKYINPAEYGRCKPFTEYIPKFTVSETIPIDMEMEVVASGLPVSPDCEVTSKNELVRSNSTDDTSSNLRRSNSVPCIDMENEYLVLGESLISILIKLYSKLTGGKAYRPNFNNSIDSRIGDGPFFIAKVLNKLGRESQEDKQFIVDTICSIFPDGEESCPSSSDDESNSSIKEQKRIKAKELQKKVMASFARKQKQFMDQNYSSEVEDKTEYLRMKVDIQKDESTIKAYDCVICSQHVPSTDEQPIGLIMFMQPSNLAGQRTTSSSSYNIPTSDRASTKLRNQRCTLMQYMKEKAEALNNYFDTYSCYHSMDIGWDGGVYVQTCGHYIHLECQSSYLISRCTLKNSDSSFEFTSEKEFLCPFCQKLSNSIIPISSNIEETFHFIKLNSHNRDYVADVDFALKNLLLPNYGDMFLSCASKFESSLMEMTTIEFPKSRGAPMNPEIPQVSWPFLFLFLSSIFRINIEMELIQLGGFLFSVDERSSLSARSSLIPLLRVLAFYAKFLSSVDPSKHGGMVGTGWIRQVWSSLTQRFVFDSLGPMVPLEKEVPLLCRDPVSMLIHFVLLLPPDVDKDYFQCIIYYIYRLVVVQACVSSLRSLPKNRREKVITEGPLAPLLALAYSNLSDSQFLYEDHVASSQATSASLRATSASSQATSVSSRAISVSSRATSVSSQATSVSSVIADKEWSVNEFTNEVREICLEFLRIASILKSRMMEESLPQIADPLAECGALERYLGLWETCSVVNAAVMGKMSGIFIYDNDGPSTVNVPTFSGMPVKTQLGELSEVIRTWCNQFESFASRPQIDATKIIKHVKFYLPRLLCLPSKYEDIFQYYHQKRCSQCNNLRKDPALCLVCGTVVSLKQSCCKVSNTYETVCHARECGANSALFLVISRSTILVVHGKRMKFWGCVHLDSYGEEDRDLLRGKPLFLSTRRYQLLEQQWLRQMYDLS